MKAQKLFSNETKQMLVSGLFLASFAALMGCAGGASETAQSTEPSRITMENLPLTLNTTMAASISPSLTLLYTLAPPATATTGGYQTYASDLTVNAGLVYTAFNTLNSPQAGAVDIINPGLLGIIPTIQSTLSFTDFDVNRAIYFNNAVWAVGAKEGIGGWMRRIPVSGGALGTVDIEGAIASYAGTSIVGSGSNLYITSGDAGGLSTANATTGATTLTVALNDARSVTTLSGGDIIVLTGGSCGAGSTTGTLCNTSDPTKTAPQLTRYTSAGAVVWTRTLSGATIGESKSTVVAGSTYLVASLGDGGFSVICQGDGAIMATKAAVTLAGVASTLTVTNAVAAAPGMVLAANGQAGVYMYQIESSTTGPASTCAKIQLTGIGSVNFNDGSSSNNISAESFTITAGLLGASIYAGRFYVASGVKGFRSVLLQFTLAAGSSLINL